MFNKKQIKWSDDDIKHIGECVAIETSKKFRDFYWETTKQKVREEIKKKETITA